MSALLGSVPRKRSDNLCVPLQVQLLEAEFVPWDYNDDLKNGHKIRAGIEFNGIGQRVAYWMHKEHPSDYATLDIAGLRRVPGDQVLHIYEPLRPGQLRGAASADSSAAANVSSG